MRVVLINLSGMDQARGVVDLFNAVSAAAECQLLDIGEAVIHDQLNLALLIAVPNDGDEVLKSLAARLNEIGFAARFTDIDQERYSSWVLEQGAPRYIVTLLARRIVPAHLARIVDEVSRLGLRVSGITRLSGRIALQEAEHRGRAIVEFSLRGRGEEAAPLRNALLGAARELSVDIAVQSDDAYRRNRRLVAFDMDSTLIENEVIDLLAAQCGVGDEVANITAAAMRGEMDFQESFRRRVSLLRGADAALLQQVAAQVALSEGAEKLVRTLKRHGYRTAILSGGFQHVGEQLRERLGIDYVYANRLEIADGRFTGRVLGAIVDGQRKAQLLKDIVAREGLSLAQAIAVGDGANDLPMLSIAGLGIAYRAKPVVAASAQHAISHFGLDAILYLIGFSDRDLKDGD